MCGCSMLTEKRWPHVADNNVNHSKRLSRAYCIPDVVLIALLRDLTMTLSQALIWLY